MGCCWATDCRVTLEVGGLEMGSWGRAGSVGGILEVVVDNKLCCWRRDCGVQSLLFRISRPSLVPSGLHVALMSCLERGWMQTRRGLYTERALCSAGRANPLALSECWDVISFSLLLCLEVCVTRDVKRICASRASGVVGCSRHLLWLWVPYWVGQLVWMCKVLLELFPFLEEWRCVSKRKSRQIWQLVRTRVGVSSRAGRDHGLVPMSTLGSHKLGLSRSIVFPQQSFRGAGSRTGCSRGIFACLKLEPRSALPADVMSFLSLLLF